MKRDDINYRSDDTLENGIMGHFILMWQIDPKALAGIEYALGDIENLDGATGKAHRIQMMVKYAF